MNNKGIGILLVLVSIAISVLILMGLNSYDLNSIKLPLGIAVAWTFIWKGLALWRAARDEQKVWFVVLLLVNTLGLLEIIYLFFISPSHKKIAGADPINI